jgi:hypothetical protein
MSRRNKPCSRSRSSALSSKCQDPASTLHVANTPESPLPVMGNASVAPPPLGGHPHDNARRKGTNDGEHDGDWANTSHKIKFPKFVGSGDPMLWLNRCEHYFQLRCTSENKRVQVASFYLLDDTQVWYNRVELNGDPPSWHHFV